MNQLFDIAGKVAIITGGSSGIGAMIARGFVGNGVRTYIASRTVSKCEETAEKLSQYGECIAIPGDLSTVSGIEEFAETFSDKEKELHILVNNAGITLTDAFMDITENRWDDVINTNLKGPFFLIQKLLGQLKNTATNEDPGRIINIASIAGMKAYPIDSRYPYGVSKAAELHLTKHLALSLSEFNITVNAISPGMFRSGMTTYLDERESEFAQTIPRGRIGIPEDIVGAAIFLSSKAGAWLTGINIPVDGGAVLK